MEIESVKKNAMTKFAAAKETAKDDLKEIGWRAIAEEATDFAIIPAKKSLPKLLPWLFRQGVVDVLDTPLGRAGFQIVLGCGVRYFRPDNLRWRKLGEEITRAGGTIVVRKIVGPILNPLRDQIDGLLTTMGLDGGEGEGQ